MKTNIYILFLTWNNQYNIINILKFQQIIKIYKKFCFISLKLKIGRLHKLRLEMRLLIKLSLNWHLDYRLRVDHSHLRHLTILLWHRHLNRHLIIDYHLLLLLLLWWYYLFFFFFLFKILKVFISGLKMYFFGALLFRRMFLLLLLLFRFLYFQILSNFNFSF